MMTGNNCHHEFARVSVSSGFSNRDAKRLSRVIFEAFRILPVWSTIGLAVLRLPSMSPAALERHFPLANVSEA
jgi:hypothetical protein